LNGNALTIAGAKNVIVNSLLTGAGSITTNNTGTLFLFGSANDYSGITTVNSGHLHIETAGALGAPSVANRTIVNSGATLELAEPLVGTIDETVDLHGPGASNDGALHAIGAVRAAISGRVTFASATVQIDSGSRVAMRGIITGDSV